ncbi:hypothetical protein AXE65_00200 [Ventosimonas gracilis]|uniref:VWFA domain-containing protein n=1 Tax=Ventosimonas gracilis TaxID=1680762 RepID=A0A139SW08_9GAMM|nr:hypothetical protein [Ventosimonas gracilis]KXU38621.1 hypothetical protein AXE65_00200 [Ventosimonas gracilis]
MQRIARLSGQNLGEALDGYADLRQILSRYLPPSTVNMYAKPKQAKDGVVEWYSELGGQARSLYQLDVEDPKQAAEARRLLAERLQAVQKAADSLYVPGEDSSEQTERLRRLLQLAARTPQEKNIYVVDGQPVITAWGGGEPPKPPEAPLIQAPPPRKRRWWLWLLLLLALLALLAALLWWLYCRTPKAEPLPPIQEPPTIEEPVIEPPQEEPIQPPEPPEPPVELPPPPEPPKPLPPPDPLAKLRERIKQAGNDCKALQQLQKDEPLLKENRELSAQVTQKLLQHCKEQMISKAKDLCPEERPPELAPEMVIVFDASGSMDISMLATPEEIQKASAVQGAADLLTGILLGSRAPNTMQHIFREPKRITTARQATVALVEQLPKDVNAGLVLVERCPGARSVGFFPPAQRGQLLRRLKGVVPMEGTPLADGISRAGAMLDGVSRESVMLVVSDGEESCNQDPCAVARDLARRKPYLKINVVDILGTGAGNCLAAATGGQVFTASNVNELQLMTRQAAQDVLAPAHCRP